MRGNSAPAQELPHPDPRKAAESDFEAAGPIYAQGVRVFLVPVVVDAFQLPHKAYFARQKPRFGECYQKLMAAELPSYLAVAYFIEIKVSYFWPGLERGAFAADDVELPVDIIAII